MKYTLCDECPCKNADNEYGCECNLGYAMSYERVANHEGEEWHYISTSCKLKAIVTEEENLIQKVIDGVVVRRRINSTGEGLYRLETMIRRMRERALSEDVFMKLGNTDLTNENRLL